MKTTIKFVSTIILTIAISYSTVLADGDMPIGNKSGGGLIENQPTTTIPINDKNANPTQEDSVLIMIQDLFKKIFG